MSYDCIIEAWRDTDRKDAFDNGCLTFRVACLFDRWINRRRSIRRILREKLSLFLSFEGTFESHELFLLCSIVTVIFENRSLLLILFLIRSICQRSPETALFFAPKTINVIASNFIPLFPFSSITSLKHTIFNPIRTAPKTPYSPSRSSSLFPLVEIKKSFW